MAVVFVPLLIRLGFGAGTWAATSGLGVWAERFAPYGDGRAEMDGVTVAEWTGAMELRKLQVRYSRVPIGGLTEDVCVTTHHFLKLTAGVPDPVWLDADYASVEAKYTTFWTSIAERFNNTTRLDQYRWYKSGPDWDTDPPAPYNPASRVTEVDVVGSSALFAMPPQVAMSVTEKTGLRKSWGRFYLPAPNVATGDVAGRIAAATVADIHDNAIIFYNACRNADFVPVVFSRAKAARERKDGVLLEAQEAIAFEVLSVQVDDLYDVIRSRRFSAPTVRTSTVLTPL